MAIAMTTAKTTQVALITGGAQRIGAQICRSLHQAGYNIVLHYRSSHTAAQTLINELNVIRDNSATMLQADLNDQYSITQLANASTEAWGRLDCLINNASSFYPTAFGNCDDTMWNDLINSNVKGAFFLSQALTEALKKDNGCIINIVDIHSERPLKDHSIYCIAKAGLAMMTKSLAKELGPNIRVNGVSPGAILWPEHEGFTEQHQQQILERISLARSGEPADIANTVRFLCADAPYITGQIIAVDGGRTLNN